MPVQRIGPAATARVKLLEVGKADLTATFDLELTPDDRFDAFDIPADRSIVGVLRDNGFEIETDCEDGYCGTCITRYLDGEPEHRDTVLGADERKRYAMICCARARSPMLVLDL